VPDAEGN
jgi:hypothetical protein